MNFIGRYVKVASFTFGVVGATNLTTTVYREESRKKMVRHPEFYSIGILTKSLYFGFLWPAFYITAALRPKNAFLFGEGMKEAVDELNKTSKEISE